MSCTTTEYIKGALATITGTVSGTAVLDPDAVYFQVKPPGGTVTTYEYGVDGELSNPSTGVYSIDVDLDTAGTWYYRFYSTGTGQAVSPDQAIVVKSSAFD